MNMLIKEFNKYLKAEYNIVLDCNYNKDEMYLIYHFIQMNIYNDETYIGNYCNVDLINYLLDIIDLGKPETVLQETETVNTRYVRPNQRPH